MKNKNLLIFLGVVCGLLLGALGVSYYPQVKTEKTLPFHFLQSDAADPALPADLPRFLYEEERTLHISQPGKMWSGDSGSITLSITAPAQTLTAALPTTTASVYNTSIETLLELENIDIQPGGTIIEPVHSGKPAQFLYTINPNAGGAVTGKLWVDVDILSTSSGETWQVTRLAIPIEIEVSDFLGLPAPWGRVAAFSALGAALMGICLILLLPQPNWKKSSR